MEGWKGPGQPLKLSFHSRVEGCRNWKVGRDPGQPLKLSFHPRVEGCRNGRFEWTRAAQTSFLLSSHS
jgi:hypothetical protein